MPENIEKKQWRNHPDERARRLVALAFGWFVAVGMAFSLMAQTTTARLSGVIVDVSGGAISGAGVTVRETATGYTQATKANNSGEYLFPSLPVGSYDLSVSVAGFAPYAQRGIVLAIGQTVTVRVRNACRFGIGKGDGHSKRIDGDDRFGDGQPGD